MVSVRPHHVWDALPRFSQVALLCLPALLIGRGLPLVYALLLIPTVLALGQALAPSAWLRSHAQLHGEEPRASAVAIAVIFGFLPWTWLYYSSAAGTRGRDQADLVAIGLIAALLGASWFAIWPKAALRLRVAMAGLTGCLTVQALCLALGLLADPNSPEGGPAIIGALILLSGLFLVALPPASFWRSPEAKGFDRDLAAAALAAAGVVCAGVVIFLSIRPHSTISMLKHVPLMAVSNLGPAVAWLLASLPDRVREKPAATGCALVLALGCTGYCLAADSLLAQFMSFWPGLALWSATLFSGVPLLWRSASLWAPETQAPPMPPFEFHIDGTPRAFAQAAPSSESASATPQDVAQLVSSGGFRLDRARALEKLQERQFERSEDFAIAWLRAAVASRATRLDISVSARSFRMRFDGDAFGHAELTDPLHALLDGGEARVRELGFGLLGALRLGPREVVLASGRGGSRSRLSVTLGGSKRTRGDSSEDTVIEARWWATSGPSAKAVVERLRSDFGFADLRLTLNQEELPMIPQPGPAGWMEAGSADCRILLGPQPQENSSIQVYKFGARAGSLEHNLDTTAQVVALVCDDRLSLDASRAKVVRDLELQRVFAMIQGAAPKLISRVVLLHAEEWPSRIAAARRAEARWFWRILRRLRFRQAREESELERWELAINRWLTGVAQRSSSARLLRETPLYRAESGKLYTLEELRREAGPIVAAGPGGLDPSAIVCRETLDVERLTALTTRRVINRVA